MVGTLPDALASVRFSHPTDYFFLAVLRFADRLVASRLRVAAAFFAERDRAAAGRLADALPPRGPPILPPRFEDTLVSATPRPEPLLLPPPVSLLTVAQARRSASFSPTPRSSYPSSMCSAWRFCLS